MKKIMTEIPIAHDVFKIKIGTLNKANPDSIYLDFGTFITPLDIWNEIEEDEEDGTGFREVCDDMEKEFLIITKNLVKKYGFFDKNFIGVFELASDRIKIGKKSYLSAQYHFKPKEIHKLPEQLEIISDFIAELFERFTEEINNKGFRASKKKTELFIVNNEA